MHTIWKLYSCCFSAMSFPRHSPMMAAKRETVRGGVLPPSEMTPLILLMTPGESHMATRTACSDGVIISCYKPSNP